jgi:hypothetical protein
MQYFWLMNGTPISGATNSSCVFVIAPGTNTYQCVITNSQGTAQSSVATVVGVPPPQDAYSIALISQGPLAYWRLNEPRGGAIAYDYVGGCNGTYGTDTTNGLPGVPTPPCLGFQGELAVVTDNHIGAVGADYVTTAGLNLDSDSATLLCWAFPFTNQNNPSGLVFLRYGSSVFGSQIGGSDYLAHTRNNNSATYDYSSRLTAPTNMWSLLGLTISPENAILYVFNANGRGSATNNVANALQSFSAGFALGADPQSSTLPERIFNGKMDELAVFDYALSAGQLSQLYTIATAAITLTIERAGESIVVSWPLGTLEQAQSIIGPWTAVAGATSPYTNVPGGGEMFYRAVAATP